LAESRRLKIFKIFKIASMSDSQQLEYVKRSVFWDVLVNKDREEKEEARRESERASENLLWLSAERGG